MEKIRKRIVSQVWSFISQIQNGEIDESILRHHKIPERALTVLKNHSHPSCDFVSNIVFRHLMENIGYYDVLQRGEAVSELTQDIVDERLFNPKSLDIRDMVLARDFVVGLRDCLLRVEGLNSLSEGATDGTMIPNKVQITKEERYYSLHIQGCYDVKYDSYLAEHLIGSNVKMAGTNYKILPDGCSIEHWKRNIAVPDHIDISLTKFCTETIDQNKGYYYRYITPIEGSASPFSMMHHFGYIADNSEIEGVEIDLEQGEGFKVYYCQSKEYKYLIIDSSNKNTSKDMFAKSFCVLVALGLMTSTVYLDECWMFAYNDVNHENCAGLMYQSLSPTRHCQYPIFTTNVYQYLMPVARKINGKDGERRAMAIIDYYNLIQALPLFPMDVFSRLVAIFYRYESVCRGTFMILSGTDYTLEVQPGVFAVGLEAISNVKNKLFGDDSKFIIEPERFDELKIASKVEVNLAKVRDGGSISNSEYDALSKRVSQLNEAFNSDKLSCLLKYYDYPLTKEDELTIKLRNTLLHGSIHIKDPAFKKYGESGSLFKLSLLFHKLSLSIPLLMAGYHGYIINNAKSYGFDNTCKSFIKIGHWNNKMLDNQTGQGIVDVFDEYYADAFFKICPLLSKFKIKVVDAAVFEVSESFKEEPDATGREPLRNFITKSEYDASTTDASIVIDFELCKEIGIKGNLMLAAIAHEVGHVIFFFLDNKEIYDQEAEEMKADSYAKKVMLEYHLKEVINILIKSGRYSTELCKQMQRRMEMLNKRGMFM